MIFFIIILLFFLIMLTLPIFLGLGTNKLDIGPLKINQQNSRNPRFFALSFKEKFKEAVKAKGAYGKVMLSKEEVIIPVDQVRLDANKEYPYIIYVGEKEFNPPKGIRFVKEIYAEQNIRLIDIPIARAIACEKKVILGEGTSIERWVDGKEKLIVYENCNLGISATSQIFIAIGRNCQFRRIFAPTIMIGKNRKFLEDKEALDKKYKSLDVKIYPEILRNIEYVDDDLIDEKGILNKTIITKKDLKVLSGIEIKGHIRCEKDIKIDDNVIVHGNIFVEGNIYIGQNVIVLGSLFSQENIDIEAYSVIGQPNIIKSIVARGNISLGNDCRVHGYISAEGKGYISS